MLNTLHLIFNDDIVKQIAPILVVVDGQFSGLFSDPPRENDEEGLHKFLRRGKDVRLHKHNAFRQLLP